MYSGGCVSFMDIASCSKQMCVVLALEKIEVNRDFIYNCDLVLIAPKIIFSAVTIDLSGKNGKDGQNG